MCIRDSSHSLLFLFRLHEYELRERLREEKLYVGLSGEGPKKKSRNERKNLDWRWTTVREPITIRINELIYSARDSFTILINPFRLLDLSPSFYSFRWLRLIDSLYTGLERIFRLPAAQNPRRDRFLRLICDDFSSFFCREFVTSSWSRCTTQEFNNEQTKWTIRNHGIAPSSIGLGRIWTFLPREDSIRKCLHPTR